MRLAFLIISFLVGVSIAGTAQDNTQPVITIPVVVHVIYNNAAQNISEAQIRSQIDVLNRDYRRTNTDTAMTPEAFRAVAADARIEFRLATIDPLGQPTTGIVRRSTSVAGFAADDRIKSSITGGDDGWDRNLYLNLWVGNLTGGVLGYASAPGCAAEKDGVVIRFNVFGTTTNVPAPFNKGRTATHEIGHWLGLRHIWGDAPCGDDRVDDTPPQSGPTRGCPNGVITSCTAGAAGNMYMNFMDFTDDACMNMFTKGQAARMRELFDADGPRRPLLASGKAAGADDAVAVTRKALTLSLYPNPVTSELHVVLESAPDAKTGPLLIVDRVGRVLRSVPVVGRQPVIDVHALPAGLYFVRYGNRSVKFLKVD